MASSPAAKTIRKFVDGLPLLGDTPNGLSQSLPIAKPTLLNELDSSGTIVRQSDCYIIGEVEYTQQLHSDLPATRLRGYVQLKADGTSVYTANISETWVREQETVLSAASCLFRSPCASPPVERGPSPRRPAPPRHLRGTRH